MSTVSGAREQRLGSDVSARGTPPPVSLRPHRIVPRLGRLGTELARLLALPLSYPGARAFDEGGAFDLPAHRLRASARCLQRLAASLCEAHSVEVDRVGVVPRSPVILVSNHVSYLDPLLLCAEMPVSALAKREVAAWPVLGPALRSLGVAFVTRGDPWSGAMALRKLERALHAGVSVLNFPEGTTNHGERVLPFHDGVFGLARRLRVPVVPVRIDYEEPSLAWVGDDALVPHYLQVASRRRVRARVHLGSRLLPEDFPSADAMARLARFLIQHDLREGQS